VSHRVFRAMTMRLRKFVGTVALFALVIAWALIAMALAQLPVIRDNAYLSVAYYVIAGLGWVLPAMPLVSWMGARRDTKH
jgi:multidrug transporter EmrE-like cation transporter